MTRKERLAYHSATKLHDVQQARFLDRWTSPEGDQAFAWDLAVNRVLPGAFDACDVLWSEPPWPRGWDVFYGRLGQEPPMPYPQFLRLCSVHTQRIGGAMICAKSAVRYLTDPDDVTDSWIVDPSNPCKVAWYGMRLRGPLRSTSNLYLIAHLAQTHERVGDFAAGYGNTGRIFAQHGKRWVMSDLDPRCIGFIADHAHTWSAA